MGLFSNVKGKITNLFTEEVEEEMPIKKEVKHVEIPTPKREVEKEEMEVEVEKHEPISESVALREEKFKFPVYFDDKDFDDLPTQPVKEEIKREEKKEEVKVEPYKAAKMVEEKRNFRPSPIISPVYGVLDKNYKKDDIHTKRERVITPYREDRPITVDDIRKKAYGTLEDELENTLFSSKPIIVEEEPQETEIDIFKELEESEQRTAVENTSEIRLNDTVDLTRELERQKQKIDELNTFIKQSKEEPKEEVEEIDYESTEPISSFEEKESTPEVVENVEETEEPQEILAEEEPVEEIKEESKEDEKLENGDLFNLIDSMYEKRED